MDEPVVDAGAPARVGDRLPALNTHDRHEIPAFVKELEVPLVHEGSVREDRKQDVGPFSGGFEDVPAQHRLASREQDEADAQLVRLAENVRPFFAGELVYGLRVYGRVVAARVAARAVEVAVAGDARDQKGRDVLAVLFGGRSPLRRGGGGRGKFQHERAFAGIFDGGPEHVLHKQLDTLRQIRLQIKIFIHGWYLLNDLLMVFFFFEHLIQDPVKRGGILRRKMILLRDGFRDTESFVLQIFAGLCQRDDQIPLIPAVA